MCTLYVTLFVVPNTDPTVISGHMWAYIMLVKLKDNGLSFVINFLRHVRQINDLGHVSSLYDITFSLRKYRLKMYVRNLFTVYFSAFKLHTVRASITHE